MWRGKKEKKKSTFYYLFISRPAGRAGRSGDKQKHDPDGWVTGGPVNTRKRRIRNGRDKGQIIFFGCCRTVFTFIPSFRRRVEHTHTQQQYTGRDRKKKKRKKEQIPPGLNIVG